MSINQELQKLQMYEANLHILKQIVVQMHMDYPPNQITPKKATLIIECEEQIDKMMEELLMLQAYFQFMQQNGYNALS